MSDLIDRQAAIRWVKTECNPYGKPTLDFESGKKVIEHLEKMPSVQPEQQWIPCSERKPEDFEEVNVTWVNHDPEPYYNFVKDKPFTATAVYYKEKWYWYTSTCADLLAEYGRNPNQEIDDGIEIIAWMPLPKPWKGEKDDTD